MATGNNNKIYGSNNNSQSSTVIDFPKYVSTKNVDTDTHTSITTKHVLVVGSVGSGKTSLIHILTNNPTIHTGQTSLKPTKNVQAIAQVHENVEYVFIDTPGFGGFTGLKDDPDNPLSSLFVYLASKQTRFDCVLFIWKKGRIDRTFTQSYTLLKNTLIKQSTPFILVVTGCEMEDDIQSVTDSIREELEKIQFDKIVCGTTLKGGRFEEQYRDIREQMCLRLWYNIIDLCAKPIVTIEDALEEASSEMETLSAVRWVTAIWEFLRNIISFGKEKMADAVTWTLVKMDLSTEDVQLPRPEPFDINQETHSTRHEATNKSRPDYRT